jgi:hypothetical protein
MVMVSFVCDAAKEFSVYLIRFDSEYRGAEVWYHGYWVTSFTDQGLWSLQLGNVEFTDLFRFLIISVTLTLTGTGITC